MLTFYSATCALSGLTSAQRLHRHCQHFQSFVHACARIFMHTLGPCTLIRGQLPQWPLFIWWSRYMKALMRLDWGRSGSTEKHCSSISHLASLLRAHLLTCFVKSNSGLPPHWLCHCLQRWDLWCGPRSYLRGGIVMGGREGGWQRRGRLKMVFTAGKVNMETNLVNLQWQLIQTYSCFVSTEVFVVFFFLNWVPKSEVCLKLHYCQYHIRRCRQNRIKGSQY